MKLSFGNYSYYDPDDNTTVSTGDGANKYRFDNKHFQQLIVNRQYEDAANYASKYHFDDPTTQRAHENDIINLRREGRKIAAIYGKIDNEDTLEQVEFMDHVFIDGGLEQIINNSYAQQFVDAKKRIGSSYKNNGIGYTNEIEKEAVALSFTFAPEKQTFLGIDWLARDNTEKSIEAFYRNSGLNEAQLISAGIEVSHKDGYTTIKFDKTNALANQIIYHAIPHKGMGSDLFRSTGSYNIMLEGYDAEGNIIKHGFETKMSNDEGWSKMRSLISDAEKAKLDVFTTIDMTEKDYSSTIGPSLDDNLEALNQMLSSGQITQQQYNQQIKQVGSILDQAVRTLGSGNYEMFSNAYNDEPTDETMVSLDNIQRSEIIQSISAADPKNLHFNAMISNGQVGTLITIDADELDDKDISDDDDRNEVKRRRRQVFVPGFMSEIAQKKINQNTSSRAIQEINSMQDYGYGFKTSDGIEIYSSMDGRFYADGQEISKEEATKAINKTLIIEDATANLKYQFTNNNGELYDREGYEKIAKAIAVRAANELHPEIPFEDNATVDDIFAKKGAGPEVQYKYSRQMQYQLYNKYKDVFEIYDAIMTPIMTNNK